MGRAGHENPPNVWSTNQRRPTPRLTRRGSRTTAILLENPFGLQADYLRLNEFRNCSAFRNRDVFRDRQLEMTGSCARPRPARLYALLAAETERAGDPVGRCGSSSIATATSSPRACSRGSRCRSPGTTSEVGIRVRAGRSGRSAEGTRHRCAAGRKGAIPSSASAGARFTRAGSAHPRAVMFTSEADGRGPAAAEAQPARATRPDPPSSWHTRRPRRTRRGLTPWRI